VTQPAALSVTDAEEHLQDALGANYAGPTDEDTLRRALTVDAVKLGSTRHYRPWATARRLIIGNTEYEVGGELTARIDRKLRALLEQQQAADLQAGVDHLVPDASGPGRPASGPLDTQGVF
jgi:hypothetical protein